MVLALCHPQNKLLYKQSHIRIKQKDLLFNSISQLRKETVPYSLSTINLSIYAFPLKRFNLDSVNQ